MTTPTDAELGQMVNDLVHTGDISMLYRMEIADAITALRAELAAERAKVAAMQECLERIAGYRGEYNMPFPEQFKEYASFAVITAREAITATKGATK